MSFILKSGEVVDAPVYRKRDPMPAPTGTYRKKVPISATRMSGPFVVETSEGPLFCADGWLCVDARGYPYPVADEEFQLIYEDAAEHAKRRINLIRSLATDVIASIKAAPVLRMRDEDGTEWVERDGLAAEIRNRMDYRIRMFEGLE